MESRCETRAKRIYLVKRDNDHVTFGHGGIYLCVLYLMDNDLLEYTLAFPAINHFRRVGYLFDLHSYKYKMGVQDETTNLLPSKMPQHWHANNTP